jgi:hypothetical protein
VHQDELHAERGEEVQVVGEIVEAAVGREVTAESDDENLAAERMNIRSDRLKPVDEPVLARKALPARRLRPFSRAIFPRRRVLSVRNSNAPVGA